MLYVPCRLAAVHACVYMLSCLSPLPLFRLLNHSMCYLQVHKHCHVLNETQVRGWAWITIYYHTLTEPGISAGTLYGSYVYVWKFSCEDEACMHIHTRRYANTHPHTQLTPQRCTGTLLNELSACSSFTQLTLSYQFPLNESVILF